MKSRPRASLAIFAIVAVALYGGGGLAGDTFQQYRAYFGWNDELIRDCLSCSPPIWAQLLDGLITAVLFIIGAAVLSRFIPKQAEAPTIEH